MKKIILLINIMTSLVYTAYSQGTTYYGNKREPLALTTASSVRALVVIILAISIPQLGFHAMQDNTSGRTNTAVGPEA